MNSQDLQKYFEKIYWETIHLPDPDLKTLEQICQKHTQAFAFENLNPLMGIPVKIDADSLIEKFLIKGRGGYCYEQNLFMQDVLRSLGYEVRGVTGRVYHSDGDINKMQRTHMLNLVKLEERTYAVDVGVGSMTPKIPLLLKPELEQSSPEETYKFKKNGEAYTLHFLKNKEWRTIYVFYLEPQYFIDYVVGNWYTSTHPNSIFTKQLMASVKDINCRYGLSNNQLTTTYVDGNKEVEKLDSSKAIREVLTDLFHLNLQNLQGLDKKLSQILS